MWTNLNENDQAILWVILLVCSFMLATRALRVLELRSKRIIVTNPDGSALEFRGMSGTEAASMDTSAPAQRATADDVRS